jgi:hypothetical protein
MLGGIPGLVGATPIRRQRLQPGRQQTVIAVRAMDRRTGES